MRRLGVTAAPLCWCRLAYVSLLHREPFFGIVSLACSEIAGGQSSFGLTREVANSLKSLIPFSVSMTYRPQLGMLGAIDTFAAFLFSDNLELRQLGASLSLKHSTVHVYRRFSKMPTFHLGMNY